MNKNTAGDAVASLVVGIVAIIGGAVFGAFVMLPALAMGWSALGIGISVALGLFILALVFIPDFAETVGLAAYGFVFYVFPVLAIIGILIAVWIELL